MKVCVCMVYSHGWSALRSGEGSTDPVYRDFAVKNPSYDSQFETGGRAAIVAAGDDFTHSYDSDDDEEEKSGGKV